MKAIQISLCTLSTALVVLSAAATLSGQTQDERAKEPSRSIAAPKTQPLNVKPGLWETTTSYKTSGSPPIPPETLARLTPEQRARLEERMRANSGGNTNTTTDKHCVTKEEVERADFGQGKGECVYTIQTSTSTQASGKYSCDMQGMKVNGAVDLTATDSEHIKGSSQGRLSGNGRTMNVETSFASKFLGSRCEK